MKKIIHNPILQLCCVLVTLLLVACQKDDMNAPVLTGVRNYAPSPNDTVLQSLQPGQWVTLTGHNLSGAKQIIINGVSVSFNNSLFSSTYAVVQVPWVIPFPIIPEEMQNKITYVTDAGSTTFDFDVSAPAPTITGVSNEYANAGDEVFIFGTNLFLLTNLTFAGTEITEYTSSNDGTYVSFTLPEINGSIGPVVVGNKSGGDTTVFNINDTTGILCNFDDVNTMSWGTGTSNSSTDFPGNRGWFAELKNDGLNSGNFAWWEGGRSINTNAVQWLPVSAGDSLRDPVNDYALKFEINIPEEWQGTSLFIVKDYNWNYVARFEPWSLGNNKTTPISTEGTWATVTIPLSQFRTKADGKDGTGLPASSLKALLGNSANGSVNIFTVNDASNPAPALDIAVDNIRVVKIQ
jgi:hypothetical protein